jgi:ABC-type amino acid transport substrate-binding protein
MMDGWALCYTKASVSREIAMSPILASLAMLAGCVVLSNAAAAATLDDVKERGSLRCGTALSIPSRGG